jgi:hypothetical protein
MRRKVFLWFALLGAIVLAIIYGTCGAGWGLGGGGKGNGDGDGSVKGVVTEDGRRCSIFLAKEGITVDGKKMTRDEAVAACKPHKAADVIVAGDARRGDWNDLKAALDAAKIEIFKREPK